MPGRRTMYTYVRFSISLWNVVVSQSVYVFSYMVFVPISFRQINLKKISPAAQIPYLLFYAMN